MDLSIRWLKDYVDIGDISMRDFSEAMSMSGSKVEGWTTEFEDVKNVVVGKILSVEPHPDSDHLVICPAGWLGSRSRFRSSPEPPMSM